MRGEAIQDKCCLYHTFSLGNESTNMGLEDVELATWASLLRFGSLSKFPEDTMKEFRTNKRYSGVSWDPTGGTSPTPYSMGG